MKFISFHEEVFILIIFVSSLNQKNCLIDLFLFRYYLHLKLIFVLKNFKVIKFYFSHQSQSLLFILYLFLRTNLFIFLELFIFLKLFILIFQGCFLQNIVIYLLKK
jgi:hypothetical protein